MTTKLTKKQYFTQRATLEAQRTAVQMQLQDAARINEGLATGTPLTADEWNTLHDAEDDLTQEIEDLDWKYETRNWTAVDRRSWELVALNID